MQARAGFQGNKLEKKNVDKRPLVVLMLHHTSVLHQCTRGSRTRQRPNRTKSGTVRASDDRGGELKETGCTRDQRSLQVLQAALPCALSCFKRFEVTQMTPLYLCWGRQ